MIGALPVPTSAGSAPSQPSAQVIQLPGSLMRAVPLAVLQENEEKARKEAEERQNQPLIGGLAGHVKSKFTINRMSKQLDIEPRMLQNLRAFRGEYDPDKLAEIRKLGGSEAYASVTGQKCRAAASWIKDVMLAVGPGERPWTLDATPVPDLPPQLNEVLVAEAAKQIAEALAAGQPPGELNTISMLSMMREQAMTAVREEAAHRADLMADKMEDQLAEGCFYRALDEFIDDLTIFPTAWLKGPVIRMRAKLTWKGDQPDVQVKLVKEWERVDPFKIYPSPGAARVDDGDLIERHRLSRKDLQALKGVDGYDDGAIDMVLRDFGSAGLTQWLYDNAEAAQAAGHAITAVAVNPDGLIDALQFWGSVQGQLLIDWGHKDKNIQPTREYDVECWTIGPYTIKAVLNPDPLSRRPYYATSYANVAGSIWGQSVADLVRDAQTGANSALRNMINNAAIASGPQVGILTDRLAPGEQLTNLSPWRIWQMNADPLNGGSYQPPITFFQPNSNVPELMNMFERFLTLADEFSGIPRYMSGGSVGGGAGRTASGLSMLMTNAGKMIKAVIGNLDLNVIRPVLERLYYYNMRYENDPSLKGDVCVVARGAAALVAKEAAQVRRNEFLAATANPIDMEIVGVEGRAAILREVAGGLDMDVNKVVPSIEVLRQRWAAKQALAAPPPAPGMGPAPQPGATENNAQQLTNGAPIADNFGSGM